MFVLACAIRGDARQGPLSAHEPRCRWEVKSSLPGSPPKHCPPLYRPTPLFFRHLLCYYSRAPSDKVAGLIDGRRRGVDERMDEGGGESLTQANTERQRGTTRSPIRPFHSPTAIKSCTNTLPVHSQPHRLFGHSAYELQ